MLVNLLLAKPYLPIWLTIPLILGCSLIGFNTAVDLQLHDTYFVISAFHIGILGAILLGIIGLLYWLFRKKKLFNWMTATHLITTIPAFVLLVVSGLIFMSDFVAFGKINTMLLVVLAILIISQLLFAANLIMSAIRSNGRH